MACKPRQQDDNSITLERLVGPAREVAAKVIAGLSAPIAETPEEDYDEGMEPF